jgi:MFS family permease
LRAARNRNLGLLAVGQGLSAAGDSIYGVALNWLVYARTGSQAGVASLNGISVLAKVLTGVTGGVLVDRAPRRGTMIACDLARGLIVVLIACAAAGLSNPLGWVLPATFLLSACTAVFTAAEGAFIPSIVPPERLNRANSTLGMVLSTCLLAGYGLGGPLVAAAGPITAMGVNAASFLLSALMVTLIRERAPAAKRGATPLKAADFTAALRFLRSSPVLRVTLFLALAMNAAVGPAAGLLAPLVKEALRSDVRTFAVLQVVVSAGTIVGSFLAGRVMTTRPARVLPWLSLLMGCGLVLLATAPGTVQAAAGLLMVGVSIGQFNVPLMTILQTTVPRDLQGRIMGAVLTVSTAAMPLGVVAAGFLGDYLGVRVACAAAATLALVAGAAVVLSPAARRHLSIEVRPAGRNRGGSGRALTGRSGDPGRPRGRRRATGRESWQPTSGNVAAGSAAAGVRQPGGRRRQRWGR